MKAPELCEFGVGAPMASRGPMEEGWLFYDDDSQPSPPKRIRKMVLYETGEWIKNALREKRKGLDAIRCLRRVAGPRN